MSVLDEDAEVDGPLESSRFLPSSQIPTSEMADLDDEYFASMQLMTIASAATGTATPPQAEPDQSWQGLPCGCGRPLRSLAL